MSLGYRFAGDHCQCECSCMGLLAGSLPLATSHPYSIHMTPALVVLLVQLPVENLTVGSAFAFLIWMETQQRGIAFSSASCLLTNCLTAFTSELGFACCWEVPGAGAQIFRTAAPQFSCLTKCKRLVVFFWIYYSTHRTKHKFSAGVAVILFCLKAEFPEIYQLSLQNIV